eukprot:2863053-Rhodomonas_salina.1
MYTRILVAAAAAGGLALALRVLTGSKELTWRDFLALSSNTDDEILDAVAFTSRFVAAERAMESARPDALFHDPYAERLGGQTGKNFSKKFADHTEWNPIFNWREYHVTWMAVRTKYIDDKMNAFAAKWKQQQKSFQIVSLGAGLDARAFRMDCLRDSCRGFFEIDVKEVNAAKFNAMTRMQATALCPLVTLAVDLAKSEIKPALLAGGFDISKPTFWLMEGLTMYLTPEVNASILGQIQQFQASAPQALCCGFLGETKNAG